MIKIGDKVDISNGYAFKSSKYVEQGIRVVRITNVQKGQIQDKNPKFYSSDRKEELKNYLINEGDILMSLTGNVGRVGVFPKEFCPAYLNQRVARIRVKSEDLFQKYLFYMLNSEFFERDAIFNSSGIAQLNLSTKWVSDYKIPLPPLDQQKKIAAILDAADTYRQKTKALITKYDALTQSLFLDMFGDPVRNPKEWTMKTLNDVCFKITDGTHQGPKFIDSGIPFLLVSNIVDNEINYETKKYISEAEYLVLTKSTSIEKGDLLYSSVGSYGNPAIVREDKKFCFQRHIAHLKPKHNLVNVSFLHAMMASPLVKRQADKFALGVAQKTLNLKVIKAFVVYYPPLELQNQFAERIQAIEVQKAQAQASLAQAEDLFNSLLQKAFKGELVS